MRIMVMSLLQRKRIKTFSDSRIHIDDFNRNYISPLFFRRGFVYFQAFKGWLHVIQTNNPGIEDMFDFNADIPSANGTFPIIMLPEWENVTYELMRYYLSKTKSGNISVLFNLFGSEREVFHPVMTLEEFWDDLKNGKIYCDEVYFISTESGPREEPLSDIFSNIFWEIDSIRNTIIELHKERVAKKKRKKDALKKLS